MHGKCSQILARGCVRAKDGTFGEKNEASHRQIHCVSVSAKACQRGCKLIPTMCDTQCQAEGWKDRIEMSDEDEAACR